MHAGKILKMLRKQQLRLVVEQMPQKGSLIWSAFINEIRHTQFTVPEGGKKQLMASHLFQGFELKQ